MIFKMTSALAAAAMLACLTASVDGFSSPALLSFPKAHSLLRFPSAAAGRANALPKMSLLEGGARTPISRLTLSDASKTRLATAVAAIPLRLEHDEDSLAAFEVAALHALQQALSEGEQTELESIFSAGGPACVHVTNLPVVAAKNILPPTPLQLMAEMKHVSTGDAASEAILGGTAALVGASCFTYAGVDFVRNFPQKQGSPLGWHRDGVTSPPFRDEALIPELVLIFCLRGNEQAQTKVLDFLSLVAACDQADIALLREQPIEFHHHQSGKTLEPFLTIKGDTTAPLVELRPKERFEARGDEAAVSAFLRVYAVAELMHERLTLRAGEMLLVNNKRCCHGRTAFTPSEEAPADRWLQNLYASRRDALWDKKGQSHVRWPSRVVP